MERNLPTDEQDDFNLGQFLQKRCSRKILFSGKMQDKMDAKQFLRDELGIWQINQRGKFRTWTCLSCLLSQVYNIYCMDPDGDEKFA